MTDGHADSQTRQESSGNSAQPDVRIPHSSSHLVMIETMARLHLQNDPLAPWGGADDPHSSDTRMWQPLRASPIPAARSTHDTKRARRTMLVAVAIVAMTLGALAMRQRIQVSTDFGTVERIVGAFLQMGERPIARFKSAGRVLLRNGELKADAFGSPHGD